MRNVARGVLGGVLMRMNGIESEDRLSEKQVVECWVLRERDRGIDSRSPIATMSLPRQCQIRIPFLPTAYDTDLRRTALTIIVNTSMLGPH